MLELYGKYIEKTERKSQKQPIRVVGKPWNMKYNIAMT
jgi:hypothetical protein